MQRPYSLALAVGTFRSAVLGYLRHMRAALVVVSLLLFGCEPPFIDQCRHECDCTGDSFACTPPKSGGCDNLWRRNWTLASMGGCENQYTAWFDCYHSKSVCSEDNGVKNYSAPDGACDSQEQALDACCAGGKCDDHS